MTATTITVDGVGYTRSDLVQLPDTTLNIVVVEGGWVFVGDTETCDGMLHIRNARNIRRWGTTSGLGQLATGPTDDTTVDVVGGDGVVNVPVDRIRLAIPCEDGSWPT